MKTTLKVLASVLTLAACVLHAADPKSPGRVISISEIETDDPNGYAAWAAKTNEVAKAKLNVDGYLRVYVSNFDGEKSNSVRAVIAAESVAAMTKHAAALENDPAMAEIRERYRAIRKVGARVLYQGVRFDGAHKNAHVYTTTAVITDEPGYMKGLEQLRALFDAKGFQDAKINAYRVLAGRTDFTHRVTIACPNADRLSALLDLTASDAQITEWFASVAKMRTVVANSTARDITK